MFSSIFRSGHAKKDGATALYIASQNGHPEVVTLLLAKEGVDVNQARIFGVTPLMKASGNGHLETVKVLLQHEGIDVNLKDKVGATAYYHAKGSGITKMLKENGAYPPTISDHAIVFVENKKLAVICSCVYYLLGTHILAE